MENKSVAFVALYFFLVCTMSLRVCSHRDVIKESLFPPFLARLKSFLHMQQRCRHFDNRAITGWMGRRK